MGLFISRYRVPELTAGFLVAAWAIALMLKRGDPGCFWIATGQLLVWNYLLVAPHELGHALGSRLLGGQVRFIQIGAGKPIFTVRLGGTVLRLSWWLGGHSFVDDSLPSRSYYRTRSFLIVLAGPATNLVLALAAWLAGGRILFPHEGVPVWQPFMLANLGMALFSLWPWTLLVDDEDEYPSDGLQLLEIPFWTDEDIDLEISRQASE